MARNIIKIPPFEYIHVMDGNANVTRLIVGPQTFVLQDHEKIMTGQNTRSMITLMPMTYCEIKNPVIRDADKKLVYDDYGQVKVKHGDSEYRISDDYPEPFPLHPQEELVSINELVNIPRNSAAKIVALRDHEDGDNKRVAGEEWLIYGP